MVKAAVSLCAIIVLLVPVASLAASAPLFPTPLHLTRQVHDSISDKTAVLEEYGYGNRLVAIRGALTSIADYEKGELVEIDRDNGTYSITRFDALAKAAQRVNPPSATRVEAASADKLTRAMRSVGVKAAKNGRSAEFFEAAIDTPSVKETISIGIDRSALVSKEALEVLLGAAYPGVRTGEHDAVLSAAAPPGRPVVASSAGAQPAESGYALPVEQVIRYEMEGQRVEIRSSVMRVGSEAPPADLVAIPAGARLVTSRIVAVAAELELLEHPTATPPKRP